MTNSVSMKLGFVTSVYGSVLGVLYLVLLGAHFATATPGSLPSGGLQTAAGLLMVASVPGIIVLFCVILDLASAERRVFGYLGLSFAVLFAAMVSINRFIQLTVIRKSSAEEQAADLARFLPYSEGSIMMALEFLAWGFFLSLACVAVAPLFSGPGLRRAIRGLLLAYGFFSLLSVIGYAVAAPLVPFGFIAWGPVFLALTICLAVLFRRGDDLASP